MCAQKLKSETFPPFERKLAVSPILNQEAFVGPVHILIVSASCCSLPGLPTVCVVRFEGVRTERKLYVALPIVEIYEP